MKVSVCITAYNHETFIAQAIESVLMQQVDFDYEIIIGEDNSPDNTREIVKGYKQKYPDKIRLFLNDRANVIYYNGRPTGRWNFANNIKHAQGEYIALLDGDDYWTSPHKLQTQVDYLDQHPTVALCFHNVNVEYSEFPANNHPRFGEDITQKHFLLLQKPKSISCLEDILNINFTLTVSLMFKNWVSGDFPAWFYQAPVADHPIVILSAQYGDLGYIDEIMATYRVHRTGIYSSNNNQIKRIKEKIHILSLFDEHFAGRYHHIIGPARANRTVTLVRLLLIDRQTRDAYQYASNIMKEFGFFSGPGRRMIKILLKYW